MQKLRIKKGKGGWEIVSGPDPLEIKVGTFLTFQEAYDTMSKINLVEELKNGNEHRERTTKECERTTGTINPVSQED